MSRPFLPTLLFVCTTVGCGTSAVSPDDTAAGTIQPESGEADRSVAVALERSFVFHYDCRLHNLQPGAALKVWLPSPQTNQWQSISGGDVVAEVQPRQTVGAKYSNQMHYFEMTVPKSGETIFEIPYTVQRKEVRLQDLKDDKKLNAGAFLTANDKVPLGGKSQLLLTDSSLPESRLAKAQVLYDVVDEHVKYSKHGEGWGKGDVEWVCDSRYGNCTDFHSLFISLARSRGIPARFEIGFPVSPDSESGPVGGYHCWDWFHVDGKGWVPVDISEADKNPAMKDYYFGNLTPDRVAFSTGRDLILEPKQNGPPLNFFVYPYAELDGKILDREHIDLRFSYSADKTR